MPLLLSYQERSRSLTTATARVPDQTQPPNELLVALVQGRDLLAKDMNLFSANTSDPVVRLSCLGISLLLPGHRATHDRPKETTQR